MNSRLLIRGPGLLAILCLVSIASGQQAGSIRGVVSDKDFDVPLALAQILIVETGEKVTGTEEGNYVFAEVPPGTYTLIFSKAGYARQVKSDVVVTAGQLTEVSASLSGEFTEMEEFVVQDLQIGGSTEAGLLRLRLENPGLMDSIGADLISRAGVSDAASALRLVSGATVEDGKYAVIRGLPDRYVVAQLNAFRLPTADSEKRAVQLDQFPAAVIESVQVSKTFTPDQQGDASGGAVNIVLKGIPDETSLQIRTQLSFNTQVASAGGDFLSYSGGGVGPWGFDIPDGEGGRVIQFENLGSNWDGAVGVSRGGAPVDYKLSISGGGKTEIADGVTIGGFASFFYEKDSSYFDNGIDNSLWVVDPGGPMSPQYIQGTPSQGDFKTRLYDVTQGTQFVQWGGLGTVGIETEKHKLGLTFLYTHDAEDQATLAQDTKGKEYYFPGYDPYDPTTPGHDEPLAAPYTRLETLNYVERTTRSLQLGGVHTLPFGFEGFESELDWGLAFNFAELSEPDKRQFGSVWFPEQVIDIGFGFPPIVIPATWRPFKPAANFTLGNLQRIFKDITEDGTQWFINWQFPFEQWTGDEGYVKIGYFDDDVSREYTQESFSNFNDNGAFFEGGFEEFWSSYFPFENHPITAAEIDVDYDGSQQITAFYGMIDLPITSTLKLYGGARYETTNIDIINFPEGDVTWIPPGSSGSVILNPGDADVFFSQNDTLPAVGVIYEVTDQLTVRASFAKTVARQTFRELSPIIQQEFLGGPIFIGNPDLGMSNLNNYDVRLDFTPYEGGLLSFSGFYKQIKDPIEFVQRNAGFTFTTPVNYPEGELTGLELELRQDMGRVWEPLQGLFFGANATFIDSQVTLPDDEVALFAQPNIMAPMTTRDLTGTPEHLYNLFLTYDLPATGTQASIFYTNTGDTLLAGAAVAGGNFIPDVYATTYGTLNLSISQKLGKYFSLTFQAKNLTNPTIETVYRSQYINGDQTKTSFTAGVDLSVSLSARFTF